MQAESRLASPIWADILRRAGNHPFMATVHHVSFTGLRIGAEYDRKTLATLWGYKSFHALGRGAVTPAGANKIVFFITRKKSSWETPYQNALLGSVLEIDGEATRGSDERISKARERGHEIHLFYREQRRENFRYYGEITLMSYEPRPDRPSRFRFSLLGEEESADLGLAALEAKEGKPSDSTTGGEAEGAKNLRLHVTYERSRTNRAAAVRIHGTKCQACGFDFDAFYGADYARSYIEVHHRESITTQGGRTVNPANDLHCLCSNCHSMAHRSRKRIASVEELREMIERAKAACPTR